MRIENGNTIITKDNTKDNSQSERTLRLASMGEMAAKIAHEIRNPLGSIELLASLIGREVADDRHRDMAERILSSVKNLNAVISNLLFFTKFPKPLFKKIQINHSIDELLNFMEFLFSRNDIILEKSFLLCDLQIDGDEELLKQVFLNIVYNAVQAMPNGGRLKLSIGKEEISEYNSTRASFVEIKITDSGGGIAPENIKKIYNPFFTTRDRGTGLGLAIAHNIVDSHNGSITVESEEEKGTTFCVQLPIEQV